MVLLKIEKTKTKTKTNWSVKSRILSTVQNTNTGNIQFHRCKVLTPAKTWEVVLLVDFGAT